MRCFYCEKQFEVLTKCNGGCGNYFCLNCLNEFNVCKKCSQPIKIQTVEEPKQEGLFENKFKDKSKVIIVRTNEQKSLF